MPNLAHDPKNPTDLLDRPIAVGDIVAWGTTYGRSPAIAVCKIVKIRFIRPKRSGYGGNEEVPQHQATDYTLLLQPLKSTGYITNTEYVQGGFIGEDGKLTYFRKIPAKPKTVQLVKNIVKLDLTQEEVEALIHGPV